MFFCLKFLNIYYWEKLTFSKLVGKVNFSQKKTWRNALALKSKMVEGIFRKNFTWHYYLQLFFVYKTASQISFKLLCLGDKRLLSEFLRKWGWFHRKNLCFKADKRWKSNNFSENSQNVMLNTKCLITKYPITVFK